MNNYTDVNDVIYYLEHLPRYHQEVSFKYLKEYLAILDINNQPFKVIHIAGTNGKGSSAKMMEAIMRFHQKSCGCFTSPYVTHFNERIRVNGRDISDEDLIRIFNQIMLKIQKCHEFPTFFEFITLISIIYFIEQKIEYAIYECGIGGLHDSTNIFDDAIDIITSIGLDHQKLLGNTKEKILIEKLGIVKKDNYLIYHVDRSLKVVIKSYYQEHNYDLNHLINADDSLNKIKVSLDKTTFSYQNEEYSTNLLGSFQATNAATALRASEIILGKEFSIQKARNGLKQVDHKCRLEIIQTNPLVIIDGAHNPEGTRKIKRFLKDVNLINKMIAVVSIKQGKDYLKMLNLYQTMFKKIYLTEFDEELAYKTSELTKYQFEIPYQIISKKDIISIVKDEPVMFIGSLYFAGIVRKSILRKK